jgi:hypothetical protein
MAVFLTCVLMLSHLASASYQECTSSIGSNFNGTAIAAGNYIWFTSVLKVSGLQTSPVTIWVSHSTISFTANGQNYTINVPSSAITFDSNTTTATTTYTALTPPNLHNGWETDLQFSGLAGNDLSQAVTFTVPSGGLPGGIKNVTWTAEFTSLTAGLTVNWQWAAAVYTALSSDYNALGVKPVDDNQASQYKNSDHAGTPENYKTDVIGGATGGGGSNYTGSLSATASCALTPDGSASYTTAKPH